MKRTLYRYFDSFRFFYHGPLEAIDIALYSLVTILVITMVAVCIGMMIALIVIAPFFLYIFVGLIVFYCICWLMAKWINS